MELQSINNFCGAVNLPGLRTIKYAPLPWISTALWEQLRNTAGNHQYQVVFESGRSWLEATLLPRERAWEENSRHQPQGQYYPQQISGVTPKLRPDVTATLERMERVGFILLLTDRNAQPWLIGTPDTPLYFSASAGTADEEGFNNYELSWTASTVRRAAGYVPIDV